MYAFGVESVPPLANVSLGSSLFKMTAANIAYDKKII